MALHEHQISALRFQARKRCMSAWDATPAGLVVSLSWPGVQDPVGDSCWQSSCVHEGTQCCKVPGDITANSHDWEAALFIYIFPIGNTLSHLAFSLRPCAANPELAHAQGPDSASVA